MIIEFADPGIHWGQLPWALGLIVVGVLLFFAPFALPEKRFQNWMPWPGFTLGVLAFIWALSSALTASSVDYREDVEELKIAALEAHGFSDVELIGTNFVANDNGEFFRGALVNLNPDSGYRYEVVELTGVDK